MVRMAFYLLLWIIMYNNILCTTILGELYADSGSGCYSNVITGKCYCDRDCHPSNDCCADIHSTFPGTESYIHKIVAIN